MEKEKADMERIAPSLYSYEPECTITETTHTEEAQNNSPATGERAIIPIIRRYGFITAPLIQRLLNTQEHKTINALKSLKKMQQQGKVLKYTITFPSERQDIDVYVLSPLERKGSGVKGIFRYDMTDIPYILEHLSITQWHISVLEHKNSKEIMLYRQISSNGYITQLPSLIEFRTRLNKRMSLCAIPVPKGVHKQDLGRLFTNVITIDRFLSERRDRFRAYVIVLICESENQIDEVSRLLGEMAETKEIYALYSIDMMSSDDIFDPLSVLYDVSRNEGEIALNVVRLR